ncbi:hypothetical protein ECBCE030MS09_5427 [Escherichia coli BCE030_MS-09]|nr:hypothetical protein ECBCE030MS09_5427 [Escherichia coli BCE030_MS-09]
MQRKSFEIPKALVWASYLDVRRNKEAPRMRRADFENLEPLCSGTWFPPPVLETDPEVEWQGAHSGDPVVFRCFEHQIMSHMVEKRTDVHFQYPAITPAPDGTLFQSVMS